MATAVRLVPRRGPPRLALRENVDDARFPATTPPRWTDLVGAQRAKIDRMLYLAHAEAGFRSGYLDVHQILLTKSAD
ncbi:hypothetical protein ACQP1G_30170 [Nocardia sp. CA-107356]|uniref:hypothetical protein n=1 Tax=Nocardia sp. CA-107356 TaxID=3239972 RepID=UPI003D8B3D81